MNSVIELFSRQRDQISSVRSNGFSIPQNIFLSLSMSLGIGFSVASGCDCSAVAADTVVKNAPVESVKADSSKVDSAKNDGVETDSTKTDATKSESSRSDANKKDATGTAASAVGASSSMDSATTQAGASTSLGAASTSPSDSVAPVDKVSVPTATPDAASTTSTASTTPANSTSTEPVAAADNTAVEIEKINTIRSKGLAGNAQIEELLIPLTSMQGQIVGLERMVGRDNPNVVMLYHLLARRYQGQAYVNGKFADSEKLYRWLTDTVAAKQKGFDELLSGSAYLAMADGYRMTRRYDDALNTYQRAIPIFLRGKKAAVAIIKDYKTFGESAREKQIGANSDATVKAMVARNQKSIDAIEKSQGNERYVATPLPDAYFGMAYCYLKKNDLPKAKEYLAKAKANGMVIVDLAKLRAKAKSGSDAKPGAKGAAKPGAAGSASTSSASAKPAAPKPHK